MKKFLTILLFLIIKGQILGQIILDLKPYLGTPFLNVYYPILTTSQNPVLFENIENKFQFSKSPYGFHYQFETYDGKIWEDTLTGLIMIIPDTAGNFQFTMSILKNDTLVNKMSYNMTVTAIPTPTVKFYSYHKDFIAPKDIQHLDSLVCVTENFPYYLDYKLVKFSLIIIDQNDNVFRLNVTGNVLSPEAKEILKKCRPGSKLIIDQISAIRLMDNKSIIPRPKIIVIE